MKTTLTLIAVSVLVFLLIISAPPKQAENIVNQYGFSVDNFFERPYVLVTSIFIHGDLTHLLSNMLILLFFGLALEKELGSKKVFLLFFISAFVGSLFYSVVYPAGEIGIGASAGIFGLIGAGMIISPFDLSFYPYIIPVPLGLLAILYIVYNFYGMIFDVGSNIGYVAHFGGLVVGLIYGFKDRGVKEGVKTMAILGVLFVIIALILKFLLL